MGSFITKRCVNCYQKKINHTKLICGHHICNQCVDFNNRFDCMMCCAKYIIKDVTVTISGYTLANLPSGYSTIVTREIEMR